MSVRASSSSAVRIGFDVFMSRIQWLPFIASVCGFAQTLSQVAFPNPAIAGSFQPNWALAADGAAILSWVEPAKPGSFNLRYAIRGGAGWSEARTIAANRRFWRHPAEVPELLGLSDGTLIAHWVETGSASGDSDAEYIFRGELA